MLHPARDTQSNLPTHRRRHIGRRWPIAIIIVVLVLVTRGAVYYRRILMPPDCRDRGTFTLVHANLTGHFKLPDSTRVE